MPKRVLVVEDDTDVRWMIADYLTSRGYKVETAIDGTQALQRLEGEAPDLVTVDMSMPIVDGAQVVEALRRRRGWERVPVLMISASHEAPEWAAKASQVKLLQKPFELRALSEVVERLVPTETSWLPKRQL